VSQTRRLENSSTARARGDWSRHSAPAAAGPRRRNAVRRDGISRRPRWRRRWPSGRRARMTRRTHQSGNSRCLNTRDRVSSHQLPEEPPPPKLPPPPEKPPPDPPRKMTAAAAAASPPTTSGEGEQEQITTAPMARTSQSNRKHEAEPAAEPAATSDPNRPNRWRSGWPADDQVPKSQNPEGCPPRDSLRRGRRSTPGRCRPRRPIAWSSASTAARRPPKKSPCLKPAPCARSMMRWRWHRESGLPGRSRPRCASCGRPWRR
jgi:hypothetical protein